MVQMGGEATSEDVFAAALLESGADVVVVLRGELDMATHDQAVQAILAAERTGANRLILDLRGLTFLGSNGLRALLEAARRARDEGRELVVIPGGAAESLLTLTGVRDQFRYAD